MDSKRVRIKADNGLLTFMLGMMIVLIGYVAWGMLTISYRAHGYEAAGILLTILSAILYTLLVIIAGKTKGTAVNRQLKAVSLAGFIISLLLLFRTSDHFVLISAWVCAFTISLVYGRVWDRRTFRHVLSVELIKKYRAIVLLLAVTGLFLYDTDALQIRWDGLLYYLTCMELDISSLSSLAVYGHIAQTYGMFNGIGCLIIGNTLATMIVLNIFLMLSSVVGFYMVLKEIIPERQESQYVISAAVYAWSPFLLGMVYYHSLDFYCNCIFVWVLFALYKRKWIYFSIFSLLFCFTKEPAIIIYAAMCAGTVIFDMTEDDGFSFGQRVKRCFARKQYYLMVLPGVLWLATYKMLGPWSAGNGGFSIDISYALDKLKNLYILNFNWMFTILAVGGSIWVLTKKRERRTFKLLLPIWFSQIAFTLFSCLFSTVNHPRYNDTNQVTLYLLAIVPLICCCDKKKSGAVIGCLGIMCLLSSFVTFDPITKICYHRADIGTTSMIYTADVPLGDGMIYNRQMLGFETALGGALEDALSDSQTVLFPTVDNNAYAFDGMTEVGEITEDYMVKTEYWDTVNKRRAAMKTESAKEFQAYQLTEQIDWKKLSRQIQGRVSYVYIPTLVDPYSDYIRENYQVAEETEYEHRGWIVKRICFVPEMKVR